MLLWMTSRSTWNETADRLSRPYMVCRSRSFAQPGFARRHHRDPSNDLLLSAGSIWEIAIKVGLGKLLLSMPYKLWMTRAISELGIAILSITLAHADVQAGLPRHHGDPFDRLLIAQAMVEQVSIISGDANMDQYGIKRIW